MIGIVDIGSNTIRLSCYEKTDGNRYTCVIHKKEMAGLSGYVNEQRIMTEAGIDRAVKAIENFKTVIEHMELESIHFFATAAIRNTANCDKVVSKIKNRTGYNIHVLSGEEEAICDFVGVSENDSVKSGMVIDIGGGSTEIVTFSDRRIGKATSMGIGSLNTYRAHVKNIVPSKIEITSIRKEVCKSLSDEKIPVTKSDYAYGIGGSIRAILRLYNKEFNKDENNRSMEFDRLKALLKLYTDDKKYLIDKIIKTAPERLHTIIPGLVILCTVLKFCEIDTLKVSGYGVREGYLIRHVLGNHKKKQ